MIPRQFRNAEFFTTRDRYGGIAVMLSHPSNKSLFRIPMLTSLLPAGNTISACQLGLRYLVELSIARWREDGIRAVWFHIPLVWPADGDDEESGELEGECGTEEVEALPAPPQAVRYFSPSQIIPVLGELGFAYHHAKESVSVLTLWLDHRVKCPIPEFARASVAVGAITLDFVSDPPMVLLVQEKIEVLGKQRWKLPGGALDPNEELWDAGIREVKEETGVVARWYSQDDFYFVVILAVDSSQPQIERDPEEIVAADWIPLDEWFSWGAAKTGVRTDRAIRDVFQKRLGEVKQLVEKTAAAEEEEEPCLRDSAESVVARVNATEFRYSRKGFRKSWCQFFEF